MIEHRTCGNVGTGLPACANQSPDRKRREGFFREGEGPHFHQTLHSYARKSLTALPDRGGPATTIGAGRMFRFDVEHDLTTPHITDKSYTLRLTPDARLRLR
jgi:hypothetical protein